MTDTQHPGSALLHVESAFQAAPGSWTWEDIEAFGDRLMTALLDAQSAHPWLTDPHVAADCRAGVVTAGVTVPVGRSGDTAPVLLEAAQRASGGLTLREGPPALSAEPV